MASHDNAEGQKMIRLNANLNVDERVRDNTLSAWNSLRSRADLGFLRAPDESRYLMQAEEAIALIKSQHLIVIGLGGSSLGGKCLVECLGNQNLVTFINNTDPNTLEKTLSLEILQNSHFLFVSKSGNTLEVACILEIVLTGIRKLSRKVADSITVITEDKSSPLRDWALQEKVKIVCHPLDIGGRFSVFSPVGLIPALYSGVNGAQLLKGARVAIAQPALVLQLAALYYQRYLSKDLLAVFWNYGDSLNSFTPWLIQLWAESLGKKINRQNEEVAPFSTPIAYTGTCDQHSVLQQLMEGTLQKSICFIRNTELGQKGPTIAISSMAGFEFLQNRNLGDVFVVQSESTEEALASAGHCTFSLELATVNQVAIGQLLMAFQLLVGVLGELLDINAFNQPGVELGKRITKEKLQKITTK